MNKINLKYLHAQRVLARQWGSQVTVKLDKQLSLILVERLASEAVLGEKFCVILHLPQIDADLLNENLSESVSFINRNEKINRLLQWANQSQYPFLEKLSLITANINLNDIAERITRTPTSVSGATFINEALKAVPAIRRHMPLTNTIVADLTADEIRTIGEQHDVTYIEVDKPALPELNYSTLATKVLSVRNNYSMDGSGIVIAVIGGEVDANHPDLAGRVVYKRSYDEPFGTPNQHETLVAGIIAGNGNYSNGAYMGVAPEATIWSYKTTLRLDLPGHDKAQAILDAAADGAHIINCSWRIEGTPRDGTCLWCKAVDTATELGAIVIKSCGNQGSGSNNEGTTTCPANAQRSISVGATSEDGLRMANSLGLDFSSRGPTADGRIKPEIVAPGENITGPIPGANYSSDFYGDGTSFAAPHVAGVAALMLQSRPSLTASQIREALINSAKKMWVNGQKLPENTQGAGFLDAERALEYVREHFGGMTVEVDIEDGPKMFSTQLQVSRSDPPPCFVIYLHSQRHYAVEFATEKTLLSPEAQNYNRIHFDPVGIGIPNFYASWSTAPPLLSSSEETVIYDLPEPIWNGFKGNPKIYFRVITSDSPTLWHNTRFSPVYETGDLSSFVTIIPPSFSSEIPPRIIALNSAPLFYVFTGDNMYFAVEIASESRLFDLPNEHPDKRIYPGVAGQFPNFFATWSVAPPLLLGHATPTEYSPSLDIWEALGRPDRIFYRLLTSKQQYIWSEIEMSNPPLSINRLLI